MSFINILREKRFRNLPKYLSKNGSYHELKKQIIEFEEINPLVNKLEMLLSDKCGKCLIYEIPTKELINCLSKLFQEMGIKSLLEAASGLGLLSCMLDDICKSLSIKFEASDKYDAWFNPTDIIYDKMIDKSLDKYMAGFVPDAVIISWIHPNFEEDVLDLMTKHPIQNLFVVGEGLGKSCISDRFNFYMEKYGYKLTRVPALTICKCDYFRNDDIRTENGTRNMCRSEILLYSLTTKFTDGDIIKICGEENLGMLPGPLTLKECEQDIEEFRHVRHCYDFESVFSI